MKSKIILALVFTSVSLFFIFSSEKVNVQKLQSGNDISFVNVFNTHSIDLMGAKGSDTEGMEKSKKVEKKVEKDGEKNGFKTFVSKIAPYEKPFFYAAIADTVSFGTFFLTGIILMAAGNAMYYGSKNWAEALVGLYVSYAGYALFGISWIFFIVAAVCWAFWGMIQYGKKKGYVMTPFFTGDSVGLSIKL
ncbi:MAG TPA: hypothetical protein PK771_10240 [Spirochaetota bacterium]|nr:hypothetical protein [Spirochaetota bacterium]